MDFILIDEVPLFVTKRIERELRLSERCFAVADAYAERDNEDAADFAWQCGTRYVANANALEREFDTL